MRLLITAHALQSQLHRFVAQLQGIDVHAPTTTQQFDAREMTALLADADAAIVGDDVINRDVLAANTHVRRIVKWGVGMDAIDLPAAKDLGIDVSNTPEALPGTVAEGAIGYILCMLRSLPAMDAAVRAGEWGKPRGVSLAGKTVGIIGMGRIGRELAQRLQGFGVHVIGHDIVPDVQMFMGAQTVPNQSLETVLTTSNIVVLCCNLTPDNHHLLNSKTLAKMPEGSYVVNVSRGGLIDSDALCDALESGFIAGAALDVFEQEPLSSDHPLARMDSVFLGSHNIQNTHECVAATNEAALARALEVLQ